MPNTRRFIYNWTYDGVCQYLNRYQLQQKHFSTSNNSAILRPDLISDVKLLNNRGFLIRFDSCELNQSINSCCFVVTTSPSFGSKSVGSPSTSDSDHKFRVFDISSSSIKGPVYLT